MKFVEFIGIDVSKSTIDVFIRFKGLHAKFKNDEAGFEKMTAWIRANVACELPEILFAFEHTGMYSLRLSQFLHQAQCRFTIISGLTLKRSMGLTRGKSDKADAKMIAEYAYEKKEKIRLYQMPSEIVLKLKRLSSYRERLVKERAAFKTRLGECEDILDQEENEVLFLTHKKLIAEFNEVIKKVERELYRLIKEDKELKKQYDLINSIKCVGPQTAIMMIVLTNGFISFKTWRQFASYAGIAPFPNESGKFKGKTTTSHLANKRIKALLSNCTVSAIQHNPEMKLYYQRRIEEGKNKDSTKNIIKNKLVSRIFAVVEREIPYVNTFKFAA
jgi:transposase